MKPYFERMQRFGKELKQGRIKRASASMEQLKQVEADIGQLKKGVEDAGFSTEQINKRGAMTVWQRLEYLVDPGTWRPLHSLYNPMDNANGATNVVDGLARVAGRWAVVIGFDNKVLAGAWLPGQSENILRVTGIYGTNPAGGGYQGISPTVLLAHKDANIAVGGVGIVSGMSPRGGFSAEMLEELVEKTRTFSAKPPGRVETHYHETGFFSEVFEEETEVLDGIRDYMEAIPAYKPRFFRVSEPAEPAFPSADLYSLLPFNQKEVYSFDEILARLVDASEHMEFRPDYGPEVYTGLCRIDGFLVGCIGNRSGYLGKGYPEYADYPGMGGKLYRQGLIKMNEFVTHCGRDRIPVIWLQDTSGIDVGDLAEKAELLGLGQSLIYSIQQTDLPMMLVVLRKGTAAAHYLMGGPTANRHNAFTLGTPATEIAVMHGETAAVAMYSRRAVKEKDAGRPLDEVADKMNTLAEQYRQHSRPEYCARYGLVDEVVELADLRNYLTAFAGAAYQNPRSICPKHQMILPRLIKN